MQEPPGLRERKKAETRSALGKAALALALERGVEAVTADDIAAAVNVSPRTFRNYYRNKEEALVSGFRSLLEVYVDQFVARPADEPVLTSLEKVLAPMAAEAAERWPETEAHLEIVAAPALGRYRGLLVDEAVRAISDAVASRTGTDPRADVYPRLVTMAAASAIVTAYGMPPGGRVDREEAARRLVECFALLRAGLPEPGTPRP